MSAADDKKLDQMEREVPARAEGMVRQIYRAALKAGRSVVVSKDGALYRIDRTGTTKLKDIDPATPVTQSKLYLR